MLEVVQAPVSRDKLQQFVEDRYGVLMDVRHDDIELRLYNEAIFPEISVLFMGDTSKYLDAVEICGMYDTRTRKFQFVSGQLAAIINGISEAERWSGPDESEDIYVEICCYAKEAVEQRGYKFADSSSAIYAGLRQTIQSGLSDMVDYAAVLSARGEQDAMLDMRDLTLEMLHLWRAPIYNTYEKGYGRLEQQYTEKVDQAVRQASNSNQPPAFSAQKAANILECLAIHAEEVTQNENNFSVWECCRLAKQLREEFPQQAGIFQGDFQIDESERFTKFGSKDWEQMQEGWLAGKPVLVFSHPVPDEQIPEGWHSYHLAGRNLYRADKLLKDMPESDYLYSAATESGGVTWNNDLKFFGVYDHRDGSLYMTLDDLKEYQLYAAKEKAVDMFFSGKEPDGQFHSGFVLEGSQEAAFIAYITDPKLFIQDEAEMYLKVHGEKLLLEFMENDALLAEYQALVQMGRTALGSRIALGDVLSRLIHSGINTGIADNGTAAGKPAHITNLCHELRSGLLTDTIHGADRLVLRQLPCQPVQEDWWRSDLLRVDQTYTAPPVKRHP